MSNTNVNMEDILNGNMEDLADKPEFTNYPAGRHNCLIKSFERVKDKAMFSLTFVLVSTVEMANPTDSQVEHGTETSIVFAMDNEFGQGSFKEVLKAAKDKFGAMKNSDLMLNCINAEVNIVTGLRQNKEKTKTYTDLKTIVFA